MHRVIGLGGKWLKIQMILNGKACKLPPLSKYAPPLIQSRGFGKTPINGAVST